MPFPKYFLNIRLILGFSVPRFHGHYIKFISSVTVKSNATAFSALMTLSQLSYKKLVVGTFNLFCFPITVQGDGLIIISKVAW